METPQYQWHLTLVCETSNQLLNMFDACDEFYLEGGISPAGRVIACVSKKVGG